jgi:signal transduction histidine kinase
MDQISNHQIETLEHLNQLKDDFLSTVSHELRSPMTNIKMATQMLKLLLQQDQNNGNGNTPSFVNREKQRIFQAKVDHYLLILEQECDRETDLLNTFLDLQQLDAGNYCLSQTTVHLQESLPYLIKPFLNRIEQQQQTLQLEIAANLPVLKVDQTNLDRILTELLLNACKFTPTGGAIAVSLCCKSISIDSPKMLQLEVTNSGVEIPVSECDRIFERFYRIPNGDRWNCNGIGLGLTLVKKLVEYLGGLIWVESSDGKTCFTVEIPIDG